MRVVSFKIEEEILKELDTVAKLKGMTRSEAIREAIMEWLSKNSPRVREKVRPKVIRIFS